MFPNQYKKAPGTGGIQQPQQQKPAMSVPKPSMAPQPHAISPQVSNDFSQNMAQQRFQRLRAQLGQGPGPLAAPPMAPQMPQLNGLSPMPPIQRKKPNVF